MIVISELFVEVPARMIRNEKDNLSGSSQVDWDKLPLLLVQAEAHRAVSLDLKRKDLTLT